MGVEHQIFVNRNLIISTAKGIFDDLQLLSDYHRLYSMKHWLPSRNHLVDLRQADLSQVSQQGIRSITALVTENEVEPIRFRCALLFSPQHQSSVDCYLAEKTSDLQQVELFGNESAALTWLEHCNLSSAPPSPHQAKSAAPQRPLDCALPQPA